MASDREEHREEPPKKRAAQRQITKDDDESEGEDIKGGTFQRASNEVLAERRIVKVRRTPAPSSTPNPFAAIKLVAPSVAVTVAPSEVSKPLAADTEVKSTGATLDGGIQANLNQVASSTVEVAESKPREAGAAEGNDLGAGHPGSNVVGVTGPAEASPDEADKEVVKEVVISVEKAATDNASKSESVGPSGANPESFQQLSGSKNAFAGSFGTSFGSNPFTFNTSSGSSQASSGFASFGASFTSSSQPFGASFSFGSGPFGAKSTSAGAFPSLSSVFGSSNGSGSAPMFGTAAPAATAQITGTPSPAVVSLQEVHVETGEEKEKAVFTADATLFEFDSGWKERGKGELKVNVSEEKDKRPRLVMRSRGNYRLLLNASLFPDMKLSKMDSRGISFVCANSAAEGRIGLTTYAVKFKDSVLAAEFSATVQAQKGNVSSEPKTPESSPKATERPAKAAEAGQV